MNESGSSRFTIANVKVWHRPIMSEQTKHVLLRKDLTPAFDEDAALAAIGAMADDAGDWRGHIPYAAARSYRDDPEIWAQYESHVDECVYCRRLIDALNPAEKLLDSFHELLQQVQSVDDQSFPEGMTTWLVNHVCQNSPASALCGEFLTDPAYLRTLEAKQDVTAKFKAAQIYLDVAQQHLAYKRISEGCALGKVDRQVIDCMTAAAQSWNYPAKSPADSARELTRLVARQRLENENQQLQVIKMLARLGQHATAMVSLHAMLVRR